MLYEVITGCPGARGDAGGRTAATGQVVRWAGRGGVLFPGKRAYRGKVAGALEPALMADGVAPSYNFV